MSLSEIEKNLSSEKAQKLQEQKLLENQQKKYKKDRSVFINKHVKYLSAIENTFWEQCDRFARLMGTKIKSYYRRKKILYIIPITSIKDGALKVSYKKTIDAHNIYIDLSIEEDKKSKQGACLKFDGCIFNSGGSFRSGLNAPPSSRCKIVDRYDLSEFDIIKASVWLDDNLGKFYQAIRKTYPDSVPENR